MTKTITRSPNGDIDTSQLREGAEVTIKAKYEGDRFSVRGPSGFGYSITIEDIHSYTVADEPITVGDRVRYNFARNPLTLTVLGISDQWAWLNEPDTDKPATCLIQHLERIP